MLEKLFHFTERKTTLKKEILGGVVTFLTMAYIIAVNPGVLIDAFTEGTLDPQYSLSDYKFALIGATCLAAAVSTIITGVWANVPLAMAPGMGLNAMFSYTLVLGQGATWQQGLGVVFISGLVFLILTLTKFREKLITAIPEGLRFAIGAGIGLFIALIGLKNMGLVVDHPATLVSLGKFSSNGEINIPLALGFIGLIVTIALELRKVKGGILIGIILTTVLAVLFDPSITLPEKLLSTPPSIIPIAFELDILGVLNIAFIGAIFSFMFVDLFDSVGTVIGCSYQANLIEKDGSMPHAKKTLEADAAASVIGAVIGTSTTTTFVESSAGISAGARTGFANLITGSLFLLALFLAPLFLIVPSYATSASLIIIGAYMSRNLSQINFQDYTVAVSAFLTILLMPLTYSISTGLSLGLLALLCLKLLMANTKRSAQYSGL